MKKSFPISNEFIYQVFSLIVIVIIVHAVYVAVIRPRADAILARQAIQLAEDKAQVMERSVFVLIRDYEQEACFILMFWAIAIMGYKAVKTSRQRALLQTDLIPLAEGVRILPEDTGAAVPTTRIVIAKGVTGRPAALQHHPQHPGCGQRHAGLLRFGGRAPGIRTIHDSLYRLGHTVHWIYRHGSRNWRRARPGPQSDRRRYIRCHTQSGCGL